MKTRVVWFYGPLVLSFFVLVAMKAGPAGVTDVSDSSAALRATRTPYPTSRRTPTSTATPALTATPTATPSQTSTAQPSGTPTATSTGQVIGGLAIDPIILGTCTAAIHDRYLVTGPNGILYRTWHPPVVLIDPANPSLGTCAFAHEHGDSPVTSLANSTLPAFGYVGDLAGFPEPHEGFKVFVVNVGTQNDEGRIATTSTRTVFHMGTAGAGRFDTRYHSGQFDLVAADGHAVHVQGMFDTAGVSSICANPRASKTVVILPGMGCDLQSLYEVWGARFDVGGPNWPDTVATIYTSPAVFDPVTLMNPNELPGQRATYYTTNYYPNGPFYGCDREAYFGPVYWYNANGPTTFHTDMYGIISPTGLLTQFVSPHADIGIPMSVDGQNQFKLRRLQCVPGLGLKN